MSISFRPDTEKLLNSLPGMVFIKEKNYKNWDFTYLSEGAEKLTGFPSEALLNRDTSLYRSRITPDCVKEITAQIEDAIRDSDCYTIRYIFVLKSGQSCWFLEKGQLIRNISGNIMGIQGIITNIDKPESSEDKDLKDARVILSTLTKNWTDEIYAKDINGVYTLSSPCHARLFNDATPDHIIGKKGVDLPSSDYIRLLENGDEEVLASGKPIFNRENSYNLDGHTSYKWILVSKIPIRDAQGTICGVLSITRDISKRRQLEHQLHHSQKMEAIGRLAGGIAHDFNNILTAILGYSEVILYLPDLQDDLKSYVEEIHNGGQRAISLIQQLLTFSRKQEIEQKIVDVRKVIEGLQKMLQRVVKERISLNFNLSDNLPCIEGNIGRIEQVFMNMVVNAQDAIKEDGCITISVDSLSLKDNTLGPELPPGNYVQITIADNGYGMSPEILQHIFEPFFTTKPKNEGTGLGLSTCYGIIKQMGGHITVHSTEGVGTAFNIYLPSVSEKDSEANDKIVRKTLEVVPNKTILLVEDDNIVRTVSSALLSDSGYRVLTATDGQDALEVVKGDTLYTVDLLFTDLIMPNMGGKELMDVLIIKNPKIKVIFTSGYNEDFIREQGVSIDQSRYTFLPKPYSATSLFSNIRHLLKN